MQVGDLVRYTGRLNRSRQRYAGGKRIGIIVKTMIIKDPSGEYPTYRCLFGKEFVWHDRDQLEIVK